VSAKFAPATSVRYRCEQHKGRVRAQNKEGTNEDFKNPRASYRRAVAFRVRTCRGGGTGLRARNCSWFSRNRWSSCKGCDGGSGAPCLPPNGSPNISSQSINLKGFYFSMGCLKGPLSKAAPFFNGNHARSRLPTAKVPALGISAAFSRQRDCAPALRRGSPIRHYAACFQSSDDRSEEKPNDPPVRGRARPSSSPSPSWFSARDNAVRPCPPPRAASWLPHLARTWSLAVTISCMIG